jgi:alanine racemase
VRGRRVALVGAVSMDLVALDLTEVGGEVGEEVVLVGRQGGETIRIEELARAAGTLPYELLCSFRLRLPRRVTGGAPAEAAALAGERGG